MLVNNAGVGASGSVETTHEETLRTVMETNFFGGVDLVRAVPPAMRQRAKGGFVTSVVGRSGVPGEGAESAFAGSESVSLTSMDGLRIHKVAAEVVSKDGREVLHVTEAPGVQVSDEDRLVIIGEIEIANGTIEMDLIGAPQKSAGEFACGFVGVAFRIAH